MNEASSRSHAVFSVVLTAVERNGGAGGRPERRPFSKLHLVDLAGSERNKKSEAAGARFKVLRTDVCRHRHVLVMSAPQHGRLDGAELGKTAYHQC